MSCRHPLQFDELTDRGKHRRRAEIAKDVFGIGWADLCALVVTHHDRERHRNAARKMLIHALHEVEAGSTRAAAGFVVAALGNLGAMLGTDGCEELGRELGDAIANVRNSKIGWTHNG